MVVWGWGWMGGEWRPPTAFHRREFNSLVCPNVVNTRMTTGWERCMVGGYGGGFPLLPSACRWGDDVWRDGRVVLHLLFTEWSSDPRKMTTAQEVCMR